MFSIYTPRLCAREQIFWIAVGKISWLELIELATSAMDPELRASAKMLNSITQGSINKISKEKRQLHLYDGVRE